MNKDILLLKNLLLSTSQRNTLKYCKDKKKRKKIIASFIGRGILYLFMMSYCILCCVGYGMFGLTSSIPTMCALVITTLSFFFTLFKTNGYLFNFKEYDMLMALPFEVKNVAACKFLYMYINSLSWYMSVAVSMMIGYGIYAKPSIIVYPIWIILSLLIPIIPMLLAAFFGFLIAKIGAGFRNKTIAQTVISIIFIMGVFALRFFVEDMFREDKTSEVMTGLANTTGGISKFYLPLEWFKESIINLKISDMLLIVGVTLLLFEIVFIPVGKSYRKINSALKSHTSSGKYVMTSQKKRSIVNAIVFKEFKRMTGSAIYMTNACFGQLICVLFGIVVLFVDVDKLIKLMLKGAPVSKELLYPAIPYIVYFFIGMVATTAITPSLEGKNYWIVQSLPLKKKTLYHGKMLFNLYMTIPFTLFALITTCISAKTPVLSAVLYSILGISLCVFSTVRGCVCGIKHMQLDWENEVEVIKQSSAVTVYLLPNMFLTMAMSVIVVIVGRFVNHNIIALVAIIIVSLLAAINYYRVMSLVREIVSSAV